MYNWPLDRSSSSHILLFLDHSSIFYCLLLNLMLIDNEPTMKGMVLCIRIWHDGVHVWLFIVPGHQHDRVHWSVDTRMTEHSPLCMCGKEEQMRAWVGYLNHQTMGHPHTTRECVVSGKLHPQEILTTNSNKICNVQMQCKSTVQ